MKTKKKKTKFTQALRPTDPMLSAALKRRLTRAKPAPIKRTLGSKSRQVSGRKYIDSLKLLKVLTFIRKRRLDELIEGGKEESVELMNMEDEYRRGIFDGLGQAHDIVMSLIVFKAR